MECLASKASRRTLQVLHVESESKFFSGFMLSNSSLGEKKLTQLKCSYVEISEEMTEILPADNEQMFDPIEH